MFLFLFAVTIFWFIHVLERTLFWLYLWQIKEYRLDRMRAHFELKSGRRLLANRLFAGKIIFLASSALFFFQVFEPWKILFVPLGSIAFFLFGAYAVSKILSRNIKFPIFTKKSIAVLFFAFMPIALPFVFLFLYRIETHWYVVLLVALDAGIPLLSACAVGLTKPFTVFLKRHLMKRAEKARENRKNLLVIGVTGSYGKTSTKEFIAHILSKRFAVLKTDSHNNTEIAIARTLLHKLKDEHKIFVVEMGAYRRGEIKAICDMVKPTMGILTGINEQHSSLFGSQENIIKAKYELIEALPRNGLAFFNGDNKYCAILYHKTQRPKRMYSLSKEDADFRVADIVEMENGLTWSVVTRKFGTPKFTASLIGRHALQNLTAAIGIALELGMEQGEIQDALNTIEPTSMELKKGINGIRIIDDSYSGNPDGVFAALDALPLFKGKKFVVMPTLIELGGTAFDIHKRIALRIAEVCDGAIIMGPDYFDEMQQVALEHGMTEIDFVHMTDPAKIVDKIKSTCREGDVVLLESRVPQKLIELLTA